jgi:hypothetical protein
MSVLNELSTYSGAAISSAQTLRLPSSCPLQVDLRRWLLLGWVTIETSGYLATAKVHYRPSHWGIAGTRVHTLYIWPYAGQTQLTVNQAAYRAHQGNVTDRIDDGGREFLNLILEYFQ